jgi:hypothetical protein
MQFCTTCGRPRIGSARICTICGTRFPEPAAGTAGTDAGGGPEHPDIVTAGRRQPGRRARPPTVSRPGIIAAIAVAIIAAGVVAALMLAGGSGSSRADGAPGGTHSAAATGRAGSATAKPRPSHGRASPSPPATSPPASPPPVTPPPGTGTRTGSVTVTRSAARHPQAHAIAAFLSRYFAAINSHNYQRYVALLSPEMAQRVTPDRFASGFAATADSAETLTRISPGRGGLTEAAVTFISHQQPNAANHEESCTNWSISLFLRRTGRGYQIQLPPPGYRAGSTPCT